MSHSKHVVEAAKVVVQHIESWPHGGEDVLHLHVGTLISQLGGNMQVAHRGAPIDQLTIYVLCLSIVAGAKKP